MNVEQRLEVSSRILAALLSGPRLVPLTERRLAELADLAVRGAGELEEALAFSEQEQQAAEMPLQPVNDYGREVCRGCEEQLERPGSGWCDSCWCAIAEASELERVREQQANLAAALAIPCVDESCSAQRGEACPGTENVHPARMRAALALRS